MADGFQSSNFLILPVNLAIKGYPTVTNDHLDLLVWYEAIGAFKALTHAAAIS